jgi:predicted metallopeptidase
MWKGLLFQSTTPAVTRDRRPQLGAVIRRLIRDAARKLPELAHVRASRILVVAGEARRASRATIRPLGGKARRGRGHRPRVVIRGRRVLYIITLRPMFFRSSTAEARVETLLHELFHISGRFDGTLHHGRRHSLLPGKRFSALLGPLVARYLESIEPDVLLALGRRGEVLVRQWLEKPPIRISLRSRGRRVYTEEQLFLGPVKML